MLAHILNLVVSNGLKKLHSSIVAVRNAVSYVRSSSVRLQTFKMCVEREKINYKGSLVLDVPTRWNSTYMMLSVALMFEKAFERYEEEDDKYSSHFFEEENGKRRIGPPMKDDWENVKVFVKFLKTFYEITLKVSASLHVTSNTFFHHLCSILQQLNELSGSEDPLLSIMARNMKIFF